MKWYDLKNIFTEVKNTCNKVETITQNAFLYLFADGYLTVQTYTVTCLDRSLLDWLLLNTFLIYNALICTTIIVY